MFRGYVRLGEVEIVNNERVLSYMRGNKAANAVPLKGRNTRVTNACECAPLESLFCETGSGPNGEYISPAADNAPWFDPDVNDSRDFAGFFCEEIKGTDALFKREVFDDAIAGGSLGPLRLTARRQTFTGWLRARTCCAANYGLEWLTAALTDAVRCEGCSDGEMYTYRCCPPADGCALSTVSTFEFDCDPSLTGCFSPGVPVTTITISAGPFEPPQVTLTALGNGVYRFVWREGDVNSNLIRLGPGSGGTVFDGLIPQFTASSNTVLNFAWNAIDGVSQLSNNFSFSIPRELVVSGSVSGGTISFPGPQTLWEFEIDMKRLPSCTGLQFWYDTLEGQISDYSNSYGLGGTASQFTAAVGGNQPVNITTPPVTCLADVTITDAGGGLYDFTVDDSQTSGAVTTQSGVANNLDGFIPSCWDGSDPNAVLSWEINANGGLYRFDIPLLALTAAPGYVPSGDGNTATFQFDSTFDLAATIDCQGRQTLMDGTLEEILTWINQIGDGVIGLAGMVSGRCQTLAPNTVDELDVNRTYLGMGLVSGPRVIEESGRCSEEGCSSATCGFTNKKVQFTLASGNPYVFGDIEWCVEDQPFDTSVTFCHPMFCPTPCELEATNITIPDCGPEGLTPPPPTLVATDCYCEPLGTYRVVCRLENPNDWAEAAGIIRIEAGSTDLRNISIKAFENPKGLPCPIQPEASTDFQCGDVCANIQIPYLPTGSALEIDSRTNIATVTFAGGEEVQGLRFVQAADGQPFNFFNVGNCASLCVLVATDCSTHNDDARVSIGTATRFLTDG